MAAGGGLAAPGLAIATGVNGGNVIINGFTLPTGSSSGVITNGGQTITYTASINWNAVNLFVVDVQDVGALPAAGYLPNGDATGLPWVVALGHQVGGASAGAATGTVTSDYSLEVFDTRPV